MHSSVSKYTQKCIYGTMTYTVKSSTLAIFIIYEDVIHENQSITSSVHAQLLKNIFE